MDFCIFTGKQKFDFGELKTRKVVPDGKVELANLNEALGMLVGRVSTDCSAMRRAFEDRDQVQNTLATTSRKL